MPLRRVQIARYSVLGTMVPTAYAAAEVIPFGSSLLDVPIFAWFLIFFLSTLSGAVAMLNRVRRELETFGRIRWPGVFIAGHMSGSWLAGAILFLIGTGNAWPEWTIDVGIILSSFGGAVFIEKMADKWLSAKLGIDITKPSPLDPPLERQFEETSPLVVERRRRVPEGEQRPRYEPERRTPPPPARADYDSNYTPLDDG